MLNYEYDREAEMRVIRAEGKAEGIAEGKAKGIAEGKAEEQRRIILNFLKIGTSTDLIVKATELSEDEIKKIKEESSILQ